jgi:Flp pilus assembly pilin Flp
MTRQRHRRQRRSVVTLWNAVKKSAKDESGAVLVEYVAIIALMVAVAVGGLKLMGSDISGAFSTAATGFSTAINGATW